MERFIPATCGLTENWPKNLSLYTNAYPIRSGTPHLGCGVGRHVDHQIVSSAIDRLIQRGANVKLYEDFPYVLREGALQVRQQEFGGTLEPAFVEMSEMLHLRQEAAVMYTSQVELNFGDRETMLRKMDEYSHGIRPVQTVHLERYWTARGA